MPQCQSTEPGSHAADLKTPCLIMLGGPPGVGKSTVAALLNEQLSNSVWLDGDDLWRMNPFTINERTKSLVLKNIGNVLSAFLKERFDYVIFSWVMHQPRIADQVLSLLTTHDYKLIHHTLVCSAPVLLERIKNSARERNPELALDRLNQVLANYSQALDTDGRSPAQVAQLIIDAVNMPFRQPATNPQGETPD